MQLSNVVSLLRQELKKQQSDLRMALSMKANVIENSKSIKKIDERLGNVDFSHDNMAQMMDVKF